MEKRNKKDRFDIIKITLISIFSIILIKIAYMTTFKQGYYTQLADQKTYKQLAIKAPRGEIRDRYGRLLAGNRPSFTVQVSKDGIAKGNPNQISLDLINLLQRNGENYIDEFPIIMESGKFYYKADKNISEFKNDSDYGIPHNFNAKESFYFIVDKLISEGKLDESDRDLEPLKLQEKVNATGNYPPILVSKWKFTDEKNKEDWLKSYKIDDPNISASKAFKKIREYYEISDNISDNSARKILIVRDLLKSQGYKQYKPVTLAIDLSEKTIAQIKELEIEFLGVTTQRQPIREYPNNNFLAHALGQMGRISSDTEIKKYVDEKKYDPDEMIGKGGIELAFEDVLHGVDGYKRVQVDAIGKITKELDSKSPKAGDTVYLSIDKDLQEIAEEALEKNIKAIQTGGTFESQYGNRSFNGEAYSVTQSGATVVMDVKTGDVLAMASYPDYDPNLFSTPISSADYEDLKPKNPNDPLGANPLYNLATSGAVQPGSAFKMVTAMAALDNGLNAKYALSDAGHIKLGARTFADEIWHKSRSTHGAVDLYKAIEQSCNYYFYSISTGYNYTQQKPLPVKMNAGEVLEYARLFGLDRKTGIEIGERIAKFPNPEDKLKSTKMNLKYALEKQMADAFKDITKKSDPDEYEKRIDEIVSWAEENPSRGETIERVTKLNVKEDRIEEISDLAKFSYFNQAKWTTADTFNLAIGQGENAYTPLQMARFTSALANGGNLVELSLVDKIISSNYANIKEDPNNKEQIPLKNRAGLEDIAKGMRQVSTIGTGKGTFASFPIEVAAKTGSAQKSGKIPTDNETKYLTDHMGSYGVSTAEATKLAYDMKKADKVTVNDDKTNSSYLRRAIKELNPDISNEDIDRFKADYVAFSWSVAFAPYDNPEIAVVTVIPQGAHGASSLPTAREIFGQYFGLSKKNEDKNKDMKQNSDKVENSVKSKEETINFMPQMLK
jgi:penicillin-binding protein 2